MSIATIRNLGGKASPYTEDNPRAEGSGSGRAENVKWVGKFGSVFTVNLKPEDTKIYCQYSSSYTDQGISPVVKIDGVSQGNPGTKTWDLNNNSTFSISMSGNASGNYTFSYSYKVW